MYESPLQVDDPLATYRVTCPSCRCNVWAGHDVPPAQGEEVLEGHTCPDDQPVELAPRAATAEQTQRSLRDQLDVPPGSRGFPVEPGPTLGGPTQTHSS